VAAAAGAQPSRKTVGIAMVGAAAARQRADSLSVSVALENLTHQRLIAGLALERRLPSIAGYRENAEAGALMAYAVDLAHMFAGAGGYVGRILDGADPGALPIQQPSKFELVVNLKTAKALGLTLPESALSRADAVIE
jgi:putative ABC transport system substrate-binding protein